jgi:hypothetical protein
LWRVRLPHHVSRRGDQARRARSVLRRITASGGLSRLLVLTPLSTATATTDPYNTMEMWHPHPVPTPTPTPNYAPPHLAVGHDCRVLGLIALPQEAGLVAAPRRHVPVQAVVGDVCEAPLEPLHVDRAIAHVKVPGGVLLVPLEVSDLHRGARETRWFRGCERVVPGFGV